MNLMNLELQQHSGSGRMDRTKGQSERVSEQQILTRLVVLMFSLAARLFELH